MVAHLTVPSSGVRHLTCLQHYRVSSGESLPGITASAGLPTEVTCVTWGRPHPGDGDGRGKEERNMERLCEVLGATHMKTGKMVWRLAVKYQLKTKSASR